MKMYDIIDDKGRYCGFKATTEFPDGAVMISHCYSYLCARSTLQDCGLVMGLERIVGNTDEN